MSGLRKPSVYLAGPTVFEPDPEARFAVMRAICARHELEGVSPLDNQLGLEGMAPGRDLLRRIVAADIDLMRRLDGGLFCLDGFRGAPEMDAGTAFEIGYMVALGKPVAGWTRDPRNRGKTWGSSDIRACPGAVAYDSVLACRHPPICPVCRVPSWKLGL